MKIEEYRIGNTQIEIHDAAYIGISQEEIKTILVRIANIVKNCSKKEVNHKDETLAYKTIYL